MATAMARSPMSARNFNIATTSYRKAWQSYRKGMTRKTIVVTHGSGNTPVAGKIVRCDQWREA
jgi:hypothetical protein